MFNKIKSFLISNRFLSFLFSSVLGCIFQTNWLKRHEYWGFFHSKMFVLLRIAFSGFLCAIVAHLLYKLFSFLLKDLHKKKVSRFFQIETIMLFLLLIAVSSRQFISGRREGNLLYMWSVIIWFALKPLFILILFDKKSLKTIFKKVLKLPSQTQFILFFFNKKISVNFIFFTLILLSLFTVSLGYFFYFKELHIPNAFSLSLIGYSFSLFSLLLLASLLVKNKAPRFIYLLFMGCTFSLLIFYWVDLITHKLVNLHLVGFFATLFGEGLSNIFTIVEGAGISNIFFILAVLMILLLPIIGGFLYKWTDSISQKRKIHIKIYQPILGCFAFLALTALSEKTLLTNYPTPIVRKFNNVYPFGGSLFPPKGDLISFNNSLNHPRKEKSLIKALQGVEVTSEKKPHIFLFIIESLREDFINEDTAPNLSQFKNDNISFDLALSNGNVTHMAWFSLFHSTYPYHWYHLRSQDWSMGAPPLVMLNKLGYQQYVFSSSTNLDYYQIGEIIFGKGFHLLESLNEAKGKAQTVAGCDIVAMKNLYKHIDNLDIQKPSLNVVFLDSTHHAYYWPEDYPAKFQPFNESFNYFGSGKKQLEMTKNRYRNSIHFVDSLLHSFFKKLKTKGLYDDSLIIITGDHGEEFKEQGHYFHGNALCLPQTHVVLYYKFPKDLSNNFKPPSLTSHMNIFPSLFDYMKLTPKFTSFYDGTSFFEDDSPIILSAKPSGGKDPYQFFLHNGKHKLEVRFKNQNAIYTSTAVEIDNITDGKDNPILLGNSKKEMFKKIDSEFGETFSKLFK